MSRRDCEGVIAAQRCYVRKPGPRTEEPFTAEEWREVMERCIAARRESMLNAIRIIVQGHGGVVQIPAPGAPLLEFDSAALDRWAHLLQISRQMMTLGCFMGATRFRFKYLPHQAPGQPENSVVAWEQHQRLSTRWSSFVQLTRREFEPRFVEGHFEAWIGRPVEDRMMQDSAHCDYWRAHPSGLFFLLRGYDEDAIDGIAPGTVIDITLPIWRVGEALLYASRIAGPTVTIPTSQFGAVIADYGIAVWVQCTPCGFPSCPMSTGFALTTTPI